MPLRRRETFREKKLRWFHAGARDFAVSCPGVVDRLGADAPPVYCCPLCAQPGQITVFPEGTITERTLTADHVPPKHADGRPLALTCVKCNGGAGQTIDAASAEVERGLNFLAGRGPSRARMRAGEHTLQGMLTWGAREATFNVFPNRAETIKGFQDLLTGRSDGPIHVSFQVKDPDDRLARTSWLKSAYLAMFALFGYRYALHPALEIVRRQIQHPNVEHMPVFSLRLPIDAPLTDCRVFWIHQSEVPDSWGVLMGPYLVFLPSEGSGRLYEHLGDLRSQGGAGGDRTTSGRANSRSEAGLRVGMDRPRSAARTASSGRAGRSGPTRRRA